MPPIQEHRQCRKDMLLQCVGDMPDQERAVELGLNHGKRLALRERLKRARLTCPLFDTHRWVRQGSAGVQPCMRECCVLGILLFMHDPPRPIQCQFVGGKRCQGKLFQQALFVRLLCQCGARAQRPIIKGPYERNC